ncbi:sensor histidine kinase [Flavobacterium cellulosilyticum]|uniref:histidine kinase n=1 Tax=Flavobacterium cellulosilyticum TaxID=2541731 RepID=A0A4R5C9L7_9FLAO|nr:HAMP domain-containing sensor histidine kinase [Flavobacterium cellulosilyticum]TDD95955.1 HAMP domain-containing histidine kinase [Flavobacterium cellulosilyticum]
MKLLAKTSLYYLLMSIPILVLSGFVCYYVITKEVKDSNNELLLNREIQVEDYLKKNDTISLLLITKSKEAQIKKISHPFVKKETKKIFTDTLILDKAENEMAINRMITSIVNVSNSTYQVKIWRSTLEYDELFDGIIYLLILILGSLFLISIMLNFWISKKLWKPFYTTLTNLKTFRASDNEIPEFEKTTIKEFTALNKSLNSMMHKMIADYNTQKKFTENASHEIQTPLAVIKSKVDLLIQSENLNANEVELIVAIDDACSKLTRLNKSLLLLTKIENRQFITTEKVAVEKILDSSLLLFEDYINEKKISVIKNIEADYLINMNPDLCLIFINNIIQNAIRHNVVEGSIIISIKSNAIAIENTGISEPLNMALLFKRFQKNSNSHLSIGLGLAIANEIAVTSGLIFKYKFINNKHRFTVRVK